MNELNNNKMLKTAEDIVKEVMDDFNNRREKRRNIEMQWLLNINFMRGNQYAVISPGGDIIDYGKRYYWEEREVFNHIAPIIESRLSKFTRVNCKVAVRPSSSSDNDLNVAKIATKLLEATSQDNNYVKLSSEANYWSELTGTAFYKITWNTKKCGVFTKIAGYDGKDGGVNISVCPPYEVYPDTLGATDINACRSLIHARAYPVKTIEEVWGVKVKGGDVSVINMDVANAKGEVGFGGGFRAASEERTDHTIVVERYERPSIERKNGRLLIVAGDTLLYDGELPYTNGRDGERDFPFVRQTAFPEPCSFYGASIIERLIPIQRAYNAVKNRKHEFINRLSVGVIAVEDGSVDLESLEEEGLAPGKIITYRQGATPPVAMHPGSVPGELRDEEDRLLSEFVAISGISSYSASPVNSENLSGYALQLIIEQDYSRLSVTTESIRNAAREMSKQILRLYRQFTKTSRFIKATGDGGEIETMAFKGSDLNSDDIVMEADSEMVETPAVRKNMVLELMERGLLSDENGKMSNRNKLKILELLGFGNWESARSSDEAHLKKAALENYDVENGLEISTEEVDDHIIHIEEHSRFLVEGRDSLTDKSRNIINAHIREHRILNRLMIKTELNGLTNNGGI